MIKELLIDKDTVEDVLLSDFQHNRLKGLPAFAKQKNSADKIATSNKAQRQLRHASN